MALYLGNELDDLIVAANESNADYKDRFFGEGVTHGGLYGYAGNDTLIGGGNVDHIDGGTGSDLLFGGNGDDAILHSYVVDDWDPLYENVTEDGGLYGDEGDDRLFGGKGSDLLRGGGGNDVLKGGEGSDRSSVYHYEGNPLSPSRVYKDISLQAGLYGDVGDDRLEGGSGSDYLDGGDGNDILLGGADDDRSSMIRHVIDELDGIFEETTFAGGLFGGTGDDYLDGGSGDDNLTGGTGRDKLYGGSGKDDLRGNVDNDVLFGGSGNDTLYGGQGSDRLTGGGGADQFVFNQATIGADRDTILDFRHKSDKIVLSSIDADTLTAGRQSLSFIGTSSFDDSPGQVRYKIVGGATYVTINLDHQPDAEITIKLAGVHDLSKGDFLF